MSESVLGWVCGSCHAYLRQDETPEACPICGSARVYLAGKVKPVPPVGVDEDGETWLDW